MTKMMEFLKRVTKLVFRSRYHPERHYMRGPRRA
jgi:hypothetical protein